MNVASGKAAIFDDLVRIIGGMDAANINVEDIVPDADLTDDLQLDSMCRCDLVSGINEHFGIIVKNAEIFTARTIDNVIDLINAKMNGA